MTVLTLGAASLFAAPVTLKELDLMIRMQQSEADILKDLTQRRLLTPIDPPAEHQLTTDGASAALIAKIKAGNFALAPETAAAVVRRAAEQNTLIAREKAADAASLAARERERMAQPPTSDAVMRMLEGKLVHMEGGSLKPYPASELKNVRNFALYFSAIWCGPCRQFTPKLVDFYKKTKAAHPDFEIVFVSCDHNAAGMEQYMKTDDMPWPAVRFDQIDNSLKKYATSGIPWLIILNDAGSTDVPQGSRCLASHARGLERSQCDAQCPRRSRRASLDGDSRHRVTLDAQRRRRDAHPPGRAS